MKCMGCKHDIPNNRRIHCRRGYLKTVSDRCLYFDPAKVYICGKITGDPNYQQKFLAEENRLRVLGYEPVNPAAIVPSTFSWSNAMKTVLRAMLQCDGVSLLPDWKESKGAKIEAKLAKALGIEVRDSVGWQ